MRTFKTELKTVVFEAYNAKKKNRYRIKVYSRMKRRNKRNQDCNNFEKRESH